MATFLLNAAANPGGDRQRLASRVRHTPVSGQWIGSGTAISAQVAPLAALTTGCSSTLALQILL